MLYLLSLPVSSAFQPLLMHIHPESVTVRSPKNFVDIKHQRVEGRIKTAMVVRVVDHTVNSDNHSLLAPDISWRPWIAQGIFGLDPYPLTYFEFVVWVFHSSVVGAYPFGPFNFGKRRELKR